jgi:nucleolar protein 9
MDYNRPRRPSPDTIAYLRSLPFDDEDDKQNCNDDGISETRAAALQALYEIRHEMASLAGNEHAAKSIEILARITMSNSNYAIRLFLHSIQGYLVFLSLHRYGSHVLQTILELTGRHIQNDNKNDMAFHADAPEIPENDIPEIVDLILAMQQEILPHVHQLMVHMCGSHVLRTLLCVLGGVEIKASSQFKTIHQTRGKTTTTKKSKKADDSSLAKPFSAHKDERLVYLQSNSNIKTFQPAWEQIMKEILQSDKPLVEYAKDKFAGPTISWLLLIGAYRDPEMEDAQQQGRDSKAVLQLQKWEKDIARNTTLGIPRPEPQYRIPSVTHDFVSTLLQWNHDEKDAWYEVLYNLAGDMHGSHCLETLLKVAPDTVYEDIVAHSRMIEEMPDYVRHNVANFVVQTFLTTIRTLQQADAAFNALKPMIISGEIWKSNRRGILWRLAELVASELGQIHQQEFLNVGSLGFTQLQEEEKYKTGEAKLKWNKCIPKVLQIVPQNNDRVKLDVAGARMLYHCLRFQPQWCSDTIKGIMELPAEHLELLAKDALGSRCILDTIVEEVHPKKNHKNKKNDDNIFAAARKRLVVKLAGRWVALASDRVGHHMVRKLFCNVEMNDRVLLVREMWSGKNRLRGNSMGRSLLEISAAQEYESRGESEWKKIIQKKMEKEKWLQEIVVKSTESPCVDGSRSLKKRKMNDPPADESNGGRPQKNVKKKRETAIDAILDQIR